MFILLFIYLFLIGTVVLQLELPMSMREIHWSCLSDSPFGKFEWMSPSTHSTSFFFFFFEYSKGFTYNKYHDYDQCHYRKKYNKYHVYLCKFPGKNRKKGHVGKPLSLAPCSPILAMDYIKFKYFGDMKYDL